MSVTLASRVMLNIQNPRLFGSVASTLASHTHRRSQQSHSVATTVHIGPFVTSFTDVDLELDSQFTSEQESTINERSRRTRRIRRLWYEIDTNWAGIGNGRRDRGVDDGTEVSGDAPEAVLNFDVDRFFAVERPQRMISRSER